MFRSARSGQQFRPNARFWHAGSKPTHVARQGRTRAVQRSADGTLWGQDQDHSTRELTREARRGCVLLWPRLIEEAQKHWGSGHPLPPVVSFLRASKPGVAGSRTRANLLRSLPACVSSSCRDSPSAHREQNEPCPSACTGHPERGRGVPGAPAFAPRLNPCGASAWRAHPVVVGPFRPSLARRAFEGD